MANFNSTIFKRSRLFESSPDRGDILEVKRRDKAESGNNVTKMPSVNASKNKKNLASQNLSNLEPLKKIYKNLF